MEITKKKRNSMYDPVYVSERDNISIEEAKSKIDAMKMNKVTSLSGFIKRHGEELGRIKFEKFKQTSKHTLEKYIYKYGEDIGKSKWDEYLSKKDSTSFEWALNKTNGDYELAKDLHNKRIKDLSIKFDLDYFVNKYGSKNAEIEMLKFKKNKDTSSYEWALSKADGDYKLANKIYYDRCDTKAVCLGKASKESLEIFIPIRNWLLNQGFEKDDILFGVSESKEICIYNKENKKRYYYDFCIKSLKLIIEYNGETFHPNYNKYNLEYLKDNWSHPYNKEMNTLDIIKNDKIKIKNAISNGYDIHIIWSSDIDKIENIKRIIKNKINENEN
jgi:very-short-patch-repair endonuclease